MNSWRMTALAATLCALASTVPAEPVTCPTGTPRLLQERFVAASCGRCWEEAPPATKTVAPGEPWVLDWVVAVADTQAASDPNATLMLGSYPFLDAAALPAAGARIANAGALAADEAFTVSHPLPAKTALVLDVSKADAANGGFQLHMKARFTAQRPLPAGLRGWVALVERVPAGSHSGTTVERQLVRAVAGPFPMEGLAQHPVEHTQAVAAPQEGDASRFTAVGWVETARGHVIAVARARPAECDEE